MRPPKREGRFFFPKSIPLQVAIYASLVIFMSNLASLADLLFHPEIPYWDEEHLIVGGITGVVSFVVFGFFLLYVRNLHKPDSNPSEQGAWQEIEPYITENTSSRLSHGICPECFSALYPGVTIKE